MGEVEGRFESVTPRVGGVVGEEVGVLDGLLPENVVVGISVGDDEGIIVGTSVGD